ncbi:MAG: DUF1707 domain-containing protein [Actinobacteria bacterium]|nr:DUF1707 domain-containing protein [Actinomycetota bacterium]
MNTNTVNPEPSAGGPKASAQNQSWTRGFAPLFRGPDQHLRVSDAERQAVTDRLAAHFGDGRLDHAEFDERVGRAMSAKTRADLAGLFDDLPGDLPDAGAPAAPAVPRRRRSHPILLLVLVFVLAATVGHALLWVTVPLLWITFMVVAVMFATGHFRHPRHNR